MTTEEAFDGFMQAFEDFKRVNSERNEDRETLRDKFAMAALTGELARNGIVSRPEHAKDIWRIADLVLAERDAK